MNATTQGHPIDTRYPRQVKLTPQEVATLVDATVAARNSDDPIIKATGAAARAKLIERFAPAVRAHAVLTVPGHSSEDRGSQAVIEFIKALDTYETRGRSLWVVASTGGRFTGDKVSEAGLVSQRLGSPWARRKGLVAEPLISELDRPTTAAGPTLGETLPDDQAGPEQLAIDGELRDRIRAALDGLSEEARAIVALRYGLTGREPMSLREITLATGIPKTTAGRLLGEAQEALREELLDLAA